MFDNYYPVHRTRNNKKGGGICISIHKKLEFKLRNDIDIFNNEIKHVPLKSSIANPEISLLLASTEHQKEI